MEIEEFNNVLNLSNTKFSVDELKLLNQGNKNCLKFSKNVDEYLVDTITATNGLEDKEKSEIQLKCVKVIKQIEECKTVNNPHSSTIKKLKDKKDKIIFTKADKGNKTVILDKADYLKRMENLLKDEDFEKVDRNPLNKCITVVNKSLNETKTLDKLSIARLKEPNPHLPRMYGLPKIHKEGEKMRPIINCIGSPTYKIARWLKNRFEEIGSFDSLSVKSSLDLIGKIKDLQLKEDDMLVSFDVKSLFPSVPRKKVLRFLKIWLIKKEVPSDMIEDLINLTTICLEQTFFTFNDICYCQKEGLAMGNPLSPFLANLYMSNLEIRMSVAFPHIFKSWFRYVDDVLAIIPKRLAQDALKLLNIQDNRIQFTMEIEENQCLPFLDLMIIRKDNLIKFGIYRKNTHTDNYINNYNFNPWKHKLATFRSLCYRLVNVPMEISEYNKELNYILKVAQMNGFDNDLVFNLVKKCKQNKLLKETTTLGDRREDVVYRRFTFHPTLFNKFEKIFKKHNITLAPVNSFTIRNILSFCNADVIPEVNRSGIYKMECENCDKIYIGQTKRNLITRSKEHIRNIRMGEIEKSAIAAHSWNLRHKIIEKPKLLKSIRYVNQLTPWENLFLLKNYQHAMNFWLPNVDNLTSYFINLPLEGYSSSKEEGQHQWLPAHQADDE